ncbi:NAD(P)H nitroreductase [Actinoplanes sp. NBRC 14428]|uniref:Nitroreductase family protein n=1 Tax=Pseudosporangium ferrugineum TaxID=439699 RepID=A0A2T0SG29_9ACTN|nr:nitroreductase family protein [Pseudosporangium ferrugineum]PRY32366.1 nitroreductase family protein [Pseudosporangium ferrugineum]BCJ49386.1 NAD(P)H nitroreductase [Actinoplanes sp. NBRC 14428]
MIATSGAGTRTALGRAARAALHAPSVFNTQPWQWRVHGNTLELRADRRRQLGDTDPEGRLLLLSCGAALHHARIALAADGWAPVVHRLPDPDDPELLATVTVGERVTADPQARRLAAVVALRRTDRRPFADRPVRKETLTALRRLAGAEGAHLHPVRPDQVPLLAVSEELAADAETLDPEYRAELHEWTHRPAELRDGIPVANTVHPARRPVPVRDFDPDGEEGLDAGPGTDRGTAYALLYGRSAKRLDLLRGGEALSALLLEATARGLATAPLSDAVEVSWPRHLLRGMLPVPGEPFLVVRIGYPATGEPLPAVPRRPAFEVIVVEPVD